MALFQNSVLHNHLQNIDKTQALQAFEVYKKAFLPKIENIKMSKEEQYQYGFLDDLFVKVLGYTLNPTPDYNLIAEQKNLSDSKKADGAVLKDGNVIAVIELKSTKTKSMDKIVNQAFNYKHNHPTCKYIITSNFEKLRFYVEYSDKHEEFNLFDLNEERFALLYTLLAKENIFSDVALQLKEQSKLREENISNELYKKYAELRTILFDNIIHNNPEVDKYILLEKTQTILDRMVFIFFAEDRGILPPNTIRAIIDHYKGDIEDRELWHFYKIYFKAINIGNKKLNIPEYNGGLFATDDLLNSLKIDNDVIEACPLALSAYDFNSDIDVNILGHIFENSLNDIEELKARIDDEDFDARQSKRKKDGVFYTPEYITKYIVDNTLGALCQVKKEVLGLDELDILIPKNPKKLNKGETKQKEALEAYREYLLGLKILDPACGSGAFLNQALNYLLEEHDFIDESVKTLMGGFVLGLYDVKKGILENNLYGVDINAEAVEIAKLSLWLRTVESGRKLNKLADKIKVGNSLIDDKSVADDAFVWEEEFSEVFAQGGFDVVIGNPPYVNFANLVKWQREFFKSYYLVCKNKTDLYAFFTEKATKLLKENGKISFIMPHTWTTTTSFEPLRRLLFTKYEINSLVDLGHGVFSDARVQTIIFVATKNSNFNGIPIFDETLNKVVTIPLDVILSDKEMSIRLDWNPQKQKIETKIFNKSFKLEEVIKFTRGIKTSNDKRFLTYEKKSDEYKSVIRGRNIKGYQINMEDEFIWYRPDLMKEKVGSLPHSKELFEVPEKLITQRVNSSGQLLVAYDNEQYYTLDTTNVSVFDKESKLDLKYLLVVLNSKLINWWFNDKFKMPTISGYELKQIPIKVIDRLSQQVFMEKANIMLDLNKTFQTKKTKFLNRIKDNFDLDKLSKKLEAFYETDFKTFLKELKKKKITLTLKDQDEWEEYFESYQKELLEIKAQIDATDKQIDEMVYALYGLSEDEVAVVEGR